MVNLLFSGAVSACFELQNSDPYFAPQPYELYLDGALLREGDTNVFSLYGLKPDTEYLLRVVLRDEAGTAEECSFRTAKETCAVDVRAFGAAGDGVTEILSGLTAGQKLVVVGQQYLSDGDAVRIVGEG